jgi:hypothetical protein
MIETPKVGFLKLHHRYTRCKVRTLAKEDQHQGDVATNLVTY